ncbi:tetratricopeptide repeat protein [Lysobacter gummosus]|uniref:Tetratricopeptide repeat protein n=1 Tax=Lysobacter gummosus TaxID=262324 RepID=A0ABY3XDR3_9GAMM|nr:tetratricopeptide repeat protein [Lysobacter gummosus]UNP28208.1 tetratricopeptide repeat protein [Lysobacter gummosus]
MAEDMDARIAQLRDFFRHDPDNADLACALADALCARADYAAADAVLGGLSVESAVDSGVRFRAARLALISGRYEAAEAGYRQLLASGDDSLAVLHDLAFSQLCLRRLDAAHASIDQALLRFGREPVLLILKARTFAISGEYDAGIALLDEATTAAPEDASAHGVRALTLFDAGHQDLAETAAATALALDPGQHEALLVAGTQSLWRAELDLAHARLQEALRLHPNSGRALSGYGQLQMLQRDLPAARVTVENAVRAMPDHIGTWHALAWAQLLQGDQDAALASYRGAYEVDRNFADTHGGLALISVLRGDHAGAELELKRAQRLDANSPTARYAQSLLLQARGDEAGAEALLDGLLQDKAVPAREFARQLKLRLQSGEGRR